MTWLLLDLMRWGLVRRVVDDLINGWMDRRKYRYFSLLVLSVLRVLLYQAFDGWTNGPD